MDEFNVDGIKFKLEGYADPLNAAIRKAQNENLVERIWARDHTLWKPGPDEISNRLGWLDIADRMQAEVAHLRKFADSIKIDGIKNVLLLGMGGSSLAPELFSNLFAEDPGLRLSVLDSTDPDAVREKEKLHPTLTLYIVSSKSGGTVETSSFFKYFYSAALERLGKAEVGKHFVAITDPGSGLAKTAQELSFRQLFLAEPEIGGRYSALSHFGLVPAALVGADVNRLLASATEMAARCKNEDVTKNPGAMLGLTLGFLALQGRDKATFDLPYMASLGDWLEQLIAESTGKEGKGILPVVREPRLDDRDYGNDRVFISREDIGKLPQIQIDVNHDNLGGQFFVWEFAIAVAGYVLGINPFDQPNVESAKVQARELVSNYQKTKQLPKGDLKPLTWKAIQEFCGQSKAGGYIALQAYAKPSAELTNSFLTLRSVLSHKTKLATTFGYGPRFLHSTGQLHKGDAGNGLFIQFVTQLPSNDLPIPNEAGQDRSDLSFGVLKLAQALGDAQALRKAGRRVLSLEIQGEPDKEVRTLLKDANKNG